MDLAATGVAMQPNEVLTPEDRMAEIEEAAMLLAMTVSGETREEDRPQTQARLAYLFQRMSDRLAARDVAEKIRERDSMPTTVTEDAEL